MTEEGLVHVPHDRGKECRDCGAQMGDQELWLRGRYLYCAPDYQARFGTWPDKARSPEGGTP